MDLEKTREYYRNSTREDICTCEYCQNLADEIKSTYPEIATYLESLGVNIEIPFNADIPYENPKGFWKYVTVNYLVCGSKEGFKETKIGDVDIELGGGPAATYKGEYFLVQLRPIHVKILKDKYKFEGVKWL